MNLFSLVVRELKNIGHFFLANIASFYYPYPSRELRVIGVTGTDGKTTTASFIYQLLRTQGVPAALISTTGVYINDKHHPLSFHVTTPSPFVLRKILRSVEGKGVRYVVIEVSSHAIDQFRIQGIKFEASVLTNITSEHLDYHRTMDNYISEKVKLLRRSRITVINVDDESYKRVVKKLEQKKFVTYSLRSEANLMFNHLFPKGLSLADFNKSNLMAAILVLKQLGFDEKKLIKNVDKLMLPQGRLEVVCVDPFRVVVDFAHTPNAFRYVLEFIKKDTSGRLIHVFGSAGKRDKEKRPQMGHEASLYDDVIILTAEDPRHEKVEDINNDIKNGVSSEFKMVAGRDEVKRTGKFILEVVDRKDAIRTAFQLAKKGDTVVITGKGHEESMNLGYGEIPWSDITIAREVLEDL